MRRCAAIGLLMGLASGGCATSAGTISARQCLDASGESVVVGRVAMVKPDGRPLTPAPRLLVGRVSLKVEHQTTGRKYAITCDARGFISDFFVSLPPGRYRVVKAATANLVSHFDGGFEVPEGQVAYLGTFRFMGGSGLFDWQRGEWDVVDEPEATMPAFRERFPECTRVVGRSIAFVRDR